MTKIGSIFEPIIETVIVSNIKPIVGLIIIESVIDNWFNIEPIIEPIEMN